MIDWALNMKSALSDVFHRLFRQYGHQHWWPGETPFEMAAGAILTQSTAWQNVEKAINNLKTAGALIPEGMRALSQDELAVLIRPSGYFNAKAKKLRALARWLQTTCDDDMNRLASIETTTLRRFLLSVHGIGPETADSILLYALEKPVFVIDAYTRRIGARLNMRPPKDTYEDWQAMFESNLPHETALFNEYHALLVKHAKEHCRSKPVCRGCCLTDICGFVPLPGRDFSGIKTTT